MSDCQIVEGGGLWGGRLLVFERLPSTNTWAMDHLKELNHGDVVQALEQGGGKGRRGRKWYTPPGGLALSVVLDYPDQAEQAPLLGQGAALAVALWLESQSLDGELKWPNDVLIHHRKVAGLLSEARPAAGKAVVGLGINVNIDEVETLRWQPRWPATSLFMESGREWDLDEVRSGVLERCGEVLSRLSDGGFEALRDDWERLDAMAGQHLVIDSAQGRQEGQYGGIDSDGRLLLLRGTKTQEIAVGDVVALYKKSE